jgi:hypothetical protein
MALPTSGPISLGDIAGEFGGPTSPVEILTPYLRTPTTSYYSGGAYVPPGSTSGASIPGSGEISFSNFYGAHAREPAGTQYFFSSGTFYGKYGYSSVNVSWFDNYGWQSQSVGTTPGVGYYVNIGDTGQASTFGSVLATTGFDKSVFNVYSRVDDLSYPRTNIYNGNGIGSNFTYGTQSPNVGYGTFNYGGTVYNGTTHDNAYEAPYYDKDGYHPGQPASRSLTGYFSDWFGIPWSNDYESNHGPRYHSVGITTFPSAYVYGGSVYLSYNSAGGGQSIYIDVWDPSTGALRMQFYDANGGENDMQAVVNYRQPVWFRADWG